MQKPDVIFEDEVLLVIHKPAGMVVNRSETSDRDTLQDWVEGRTAGEVRAIVDDEMVETFFRRSGLAHRLDRDTSGVMLIGKTPEALAELMRQFKQREVSKQYVALVHGRLDPVENTIVLPIARNPQQRQQFRVMPFGKLAETAYRVEGYYLRDDDERQSTYSLVRLWPRTGRTHQIRVHCKHLGHPLVGDSVYASRKQVHHDQLWCERQFLHASKIGFSHPKTREQVSFEAPLATDLKAVLAQLKRL